MKDYTKKLQNSLRKNFQDLCLALDKNQVQYFIVGGTLLGAVRHQGFIPWDDDIDIALPRPDYNKFIESAHLILPQHLKLETHTENKEYPYLFAKIYDTRTTLIEGFSQPLIRGIYIDVFPLDGIPEKKITQNARIKRVRTYQKIYRRIYTGCLYSQTLFKRCWHKLLSPIIKLLVSKKKILNYLGKITQEKDWENSKFIINYFGSWKEKEIHEKEWYTKRVPMTFECIQTWGPLNYDSVLKKLYGNYMELPPLEKRKSHHNIKYLNLENSYIDYKS